MTTRSIKVMEFCQDNLLETIRGTLGNSRTVVGPRKVAKKDDKKLNLFTLQTPVEEVVDVTDIIPAWIYPKEKGKNMSAVKLAQLFVIELAPCVV
ncbi:hypothetical protein [Domibacillus robiginosus]|uniref:hypothetical protein n=1 Tax=Domibacillus robiginosus TaxID=1071054 RepID=UPI00067E56E3|nr:hypothetical protein [Domibacillus robiginosus]